MKWRARESKGTSLRSLPMPAARLAICWLAPILRRMANVRSGSEFESLLLLEKLSPAGPGPETISSFGDCEFDANTICVDVNALTSFPRQAERI